MTRRLAIASAALLAACAGSLASATAATRQSPFYVAPPKSTVPTQECRNLAYCYGYRGPWVVVPASGEATFLLGCPERAAALGAFLLGGADSRTSSSHVRVWYEGRLGAPLGTLTTESSHTGLLFHASTDDGKQASFQPIVGCISLKQATKRSTVSARHEAKPPTHAAPSPNYRSTNVVLEPGWDRTIAKTCNRGETVVGGWSAVAFDTSDPPTLPAPGAVRVATSTTRKSATARVRTSTSVPYLIRIQVGAICEP